MASMMTRDSSEYSDPKWQPVQFSVAPSLSLSQSSLGLGNGIDIRMPIPSLKLVFPKVPQHVLVLCFVEVGTLAAGRDGGWVM